MVLSRRRCPRLLLIQVPTSWGPGPFCVSLVQPHAATSLSIPRTLGHSENGRGARVYYFSPRLLSVFYCPLIIVSWDVRDDSAITDWHRSRSRAVSSFRRVLKSSEESSSVPAIYKLRRRFLHFYFHIFSLLTITSKTSSFTGQSRFNFNFLQFIILIPLFFNAFNNSIYEFKIFIML